MERCVFLQLTTINPQISKYPLCVDTNQFCMKTQMLFMTTNPILTEHIRGVQQGMFLYNFSTESKHCAYDTAIGPEG